MFFFSWAGLYIDMMILAVVESNPVFHLNMLILTLSSH